MITTIRKNSYYLLILLLIVCNIGCTNVSDKNDNYSYLYKDLRFEMPKLNKPVFPDRRISLKDFGAIADGKTLNTEAFEKAMVYLNEKGGGTLVVPSGIWLTGPIVFKSNINLHLEKGALLLFSPDIELYSLVLTTYEGVETKRCQSPISGRNLDNIAITGDGAINGCGEAWRPLKRAKVTDAYWKKVTRTSGVLKDESLWFPSEKALKGDTLDKSNMTEADWLSIKDYLRPVMISLVECKNILLEGVLFENSPNWNIHPLLCENLIIDNIEVRNPAYAQNGDGLDIESCRNVIVVNSTFDVGDDAICIKSGKNEEGRKRGKPTENVIIENCRVFKGHGGFVVGSEMSGDVRNISVSNCLFMGTDIGLRFKSARGRGGIVENIFITDINMFDIVHEPLSVDLYYFTKKTEEIPPVDETTPIFKNIFISNIIAKNANKAMFINGLPEMSISNIHINNAIITAKQGAELVEVDSINMNNVEIYPENGSALILNNAKNINVENFKYPADMKTDIVTIAGDRSANINLPENISKLINNK